MSTITARSIRRWLVRNGKLKARELRPNLTADGGTCHPTKTWTKGRLRLFSAAVELRLALAHKRYMAIIAALLYRHPCRKYFSMGLMKHGVVPRDTRPEGAA